jgi:serine/threonine-protein kinase HipA
MENKCLYCYDPVEEGQDFHKKCSLKFFGEYPAPQIEYTLDQMDKLAKSVVERSISVPGVQPKLSMTLIKKTKKKANNRLTVVGALGGQFIFKPPSDKFPEMPGNEHLTMRIAEAFGINVVPSSLIRLASGELSYITARIDRTKDGSKIHMIDMFQITEAFDKYKSSMEKIGKAIDSYSDNTLLDKIFYFEIVLFSFLTGNNDMHLKNFSMIKRASGWTLSPAYDLLNVTIILPDDTEELALSLAGKKKKLKRRHFEQLGKDLGLNHKQIDRTFKRFLSHKLKAINLIEKSFLSNNMKAAYKELIEKRYKQIELI